MPKQRKKRRQPGGKRQVETALPKRQYKQINRMLYVVSAILLVVFGGGAALIGSASPGSPPPPTSLPAVAPIVEQLPAGNQGEQKEEFTTTPTPVSPTTTPTP